MYKLFSDISIEELYKSHGLSKLDSMFITWLKTENLELANNLIEARAIAFKQDDKSLLIIELAYALEKFLGMLFSIKEELENTKKEHFKFENLLFYQRQFIQRRVIKQLKISDEEIGEKIGPAINTLKKAGFDLDDELLFIDSLVKLQQSDVINKDLILNAAEIYSAWAIRTSAGRDKHRDGILFKVPAKTDYENLINVTECQKSAKARKSFIVEDNNINIENAINNANYCIYCHNQGKDSCSKGLRNNDNTDFLHNPLDVKLTGCPLGEKISEMNFLKKHGFIIAALAVAVIDNPMVAATGYRICNDCMKSCIYQKQQPVDIPLIETENLEQVLNLTYGFEIYSLLTRWNPLNFKNYIPKPITDYKVLVVGLGPAGFTLSHYLLNAGVIVVAIDGLKIQPLDPSISGIDQLGRREKFHAIKNIQKELYDKLDTRIPQGFGGVMEYGITSRWNKNYLKVIRLLLERRENFRMYDSVRFGSSINYNKALDLGFDHISLAMGAGKPNIPEIPNVLVKGIRTASDFLMSLQLLGSHLQNSTASLQIRLPIVVIGGGLTAVDTAAESLAYYALQVEKFLSLYEKLSPSIFNDLTEEESEIAREFIKHGSMLRAFPERKLELLKEWGGVSIVYRKTLRESPCYKLNHEEVKKALEEGVEFIENIIPVEVLVDQYNAVCALKHQDGVMKARTIFIATGTSPNTSIADEDPKHFILDGRSFRLLDAEGNKVIAEKSHKPINTYVLHNINEKIGVSYFGDLHPSYNGSVVSAMASAKNGWRAVYNELLKRSANIKILHNKFFDVLNESLISKVEAVNRLTPNIVEVVVKSPFAAINFQPGQFYRLQNYSQNAISCMEGIALTGAWVDKENGLIAMIVLEIGASTDLCAKLRKGEIVSLMGPTGSPTDIPKNKNVMLVGGGLGNAVLFSIGKAMRANGCKVLYFAGYKKLIDRYKVSEIEDAADCVVWCCQEGILPSNREVDYSVHGNIIDGIKCYSGNQIKLQDIDYMMVIGSDKMMHAVSNARYNELKDLLKWPHIAVASVNSPMQCMMKEICAQCLQKHVDPVTQKEFYVYSCKQQDQNMDYIDFQHLALRLGQNSLQEKFIRKHREMMCA